MSTEAADSIESLTHIYNTLADGKWNGMMTIPPGICVKYQNRPPLTTFPEEWSKQWKLNILRNSALSTVTLPISSANVTPSAAASSMAGEVVHTLQLRGIDSGMAIQRIVIDNGTLRPGYVGPDLQ